MANKISSSLITYMYYIRADGLTLVRNAPKIIDIQIICK